MRLIDADELIEHIKCNDTTGDAIEDINLAPTIEAIPIKWLNARARDYSDMLDDYENKIKGLIEIWRKWDE